MSIWIVILVFCFLELKVAGLWNTPADSAKEAGK